MRLVFKEDADYDKNQGCKELFSKETVEMFGSNPTCKWYSSKGIIVKFGPDNKLKDPNVPKQTLKILSENFTKKSKVNLISHEIIELKPDY